MDKVKLDKYLRANGGLTKNQALKFFMWSFFKIKKCLYFYRLCEDGHSNFTAFNRADRDSSNIIMAYLDGK